jgi:predicted XRE-type DNA-binding protein
MNDSEQPHVTASSGNVFADLGLPDAKERLAKAELARQIGAVIRKRALRQSAPAKPLGIDQPKVSALLNGHLSGFSFERLAHFLNLLGKDVEITVTDAESKERAGRLRVRAAP